MSVGVGIIGCGLIGQKRARALGRERLVACADLDEGCARRLADASKAKVFGDWREILALPEVEIVIIATPHNSLANITLAAVKAGKHALVEKPSARNSAELEAVMAAAERCQVKVHVGFNHRYHRAFRKARELCEAGALGEMMFVRGRYGHGGRVGYEKGWRADPAVSGGGELIDQGVHLIDLARMYLGEFVDVRGVAQTCYWPMPADDNAFLLLRTAEGRTAFLHVSCTEWKNLFSFEIYGRLGKLHIEGLGGSYGVERLSHYRMLPQMGPPETTIWEYPMADDSWEVEFEEFLEDIRLGRQPAASLPDARAALTIVEKVYRESGYDYHS